MKNTSPATSGPLVTVIIPSYNHALFIGAAIDSIFAQTYKDLEVFVIDDGSPDDSARVICELQKKYDFTFIALEKNKGANGNIAHCLEMAKGKYVATLDSDDIWLPGKIAAQVAQLEKNPDAVLSYGHYQLLRPNGQIEDVEPMMRSGWVFNQVLFGNWILPITALYRKDAYLKTRGLDNDIFQGDWDFYLQLAKLGKFLSLPEVFGLYRLHGNNNWFHGEVDLKYRDRMAILAKWRDEPLYDLAVEQKWMFHLKTITDLVEIRRLLDKWPTDPQLHFLYAYHALAKGLHDEVKKHILQAVEFIDPNTPMAPLVFTMAIKAHRDDLAKVLELVERYQTAADPKGPEPMFQAAEQLLNGIGRVVSEQLQDTLNCIRQLLERCLEIGESRSRLWKITGMGSYKPLEQLADLKQALGQYDEARHLMRLAIEYGSVEALSKYDDRFGALS